MHSENRDDICTASSQYPNKYSIAFEAEYILCTLTEITWLRFNADMNHHVPMRDTYIHSGGRLPELRALRLEPSSDARIGNLLTPSQQALLQSIAPLISFRHGEEISTEGAEAHFVYTVAAGMVRISRCAESGRRQVMSFALPGDLFGFPQQGRYLNSTKAVGEASLYRMPWLELNALMQREPALQSSFLERMVFDLRQAQKRILVLGQQNVSQRLATFLLELMEHDDFYDAGKRQLRLPLSRFDLGDYLGTSPETVVRVLARMEKDGLLRRMPSRLLLIHDPAALAQLLRGRRRND